LKTFLTAVILYFCYFFIKSAIISEADAEKFKKDVILPKEIVDIGKYVLIGVGCLVMLIGLILLRYRRTVRITVATSICAATHSRALFAILNIS
jgi:nitrate reductase gamma subunit